jgi:hypothetical protein
MDNGHAGGAVHISPLLPRDFATFTLKGYASFASARPVEILAASCEKFSAFQTRVNPC